MKKFITKRWKFIDATKNKGATYPEIYEILANNGFPGTFTTFYTYCLEVSRMTKARRKRCAKS